MCPVIVLYTQVINKHTYNVHANVHVHVRKTHDIVQLHITLSTLYWYYTSKEVGHNSICNSICQQVHVFHNKKMQPINTALYVSNIQYIYIHVMYKLMEKLPLNLYE